MPKDMREPQSYGSDQDWQSGKTGQEVNEQKSVPKPEHSDFYDEARESETSDGYQGGRTSPFQLAENIQPTGEATGGSLPTQRVSSEKGGARRDSYFKKRDYE